MAVRRIPNIIDRSNVTITNATLAELGHSFNTRITPATKAGMRTTAEQILEHRPLANAFLDRLINKIGTTIARRKSWTNPLAEFKTGLLEWGDTIEETDIGLVKAKQYNTDRDYLERDIFGTEVPDVATAYHTVNREDYYKISVKEDELRKAFLSSEGLYEMVDAIMESPTNSDQLDEFLLMCQLFPQYESMGGYFRIGVPDVRGIATDSAEARQVMKEVRTMAETLTFFSPKYNAAKRMTFTPREDLVLFATPEFNATMDVDVLANAFNVERTALPGRQITIPHDQFGMTGAQAILTTKDFFIVRDRLLETRTASNPVGLNENVFLHHHQVISHSPFANAILFTTEGDDREAYEIRPATGITQIVVTDRAGEVATGVQPRGAVLVAYADAVHNGGEDEFQTPDVRWHVTGNEDSRTRITQHGTLHIGGRETASTITVHATTVFIDPDAPGGQVYTATATVAVDLDSTMLPAWPNTRPEEEPEEPVEP